MTFNKYVTVTQSEGKAAFKLPALGYGSYGPDAQTLVVETSENTIWPYQDNMTITLQDPSWITDAHMVPGGLSLTLTENKTGSPRQQNLTLTYVSDAGEIINGKFTVIQSTK